MKKLYALYLHFLLVMVSMVILPNITKAGNNNFTHERVAVNGRHTDHEQRAPTIIGATISEGTFMRGDELVVTLTMSEDVTVNGPVLIPLFFDVGGSILAQYVPDGNPRVLTFKANISQPVFDTTGVSLGGNYSGGSISGLSPFIPAYTSTHTIVDAIAPVISSVTVTEGKLKAGDEVEVVLHMSEEVTVTGAPTIWLLFDQGNPLEATYVPDGNPNVIRFKATIPTEYYDSTGIRVTGSFVGGTIQDLAGNRLPYVFYDSPNSLVDAMLPYIVSVTLPANKVYHIGEDLIFTLNFSEAVVQYGTPTMAFQIYPGRLLQATYLDSLDTNKRRYKYTVTAGDDARDGLGFIGVPVLSYGNGGYHDDFGNPIANSRIWTIVYYPNGVIMDGIRPEITNIRLVPPAIRNDDKAYFQVTFSKAMANIDHQVITSPGLTAVENIITTDNKYFQYNYTVSGNGTIRLAFPASATTKDTVGNDMSISYMSDAFTIDQTAPTISRLELPADSTYKAGDALTFTAHFSEPVVLNGSVNDISLKMLIGSTVQTLPAISTKDSSATFQYIITSSDNDADGITIQSLELSSANTITDSATNKLVTTLQPAQVVNQIKIDNIKPSITGYTTTSGRYGTGQVISILAQFDEPVIVTGTPYLTATVGAGQQQFDYVGGTGTTTLRFNYMVTAGREDSATLLLQRRVELNGGAIKDVTGNDVNIPAPGTTTFNGIYLDGVRPTVTGIQLTDPVLTTTGILHFVITTSEPVTTTDLSKLITVNTAVTVSSVVVTQTDATTFQVAVDVASVADTVLPVTITVPGAVPLKDLAGNDITAAFTSNAYSIDGILPVITGITLPPDKIYKAGDLMLFYVHTNKTVQLKDGLATLDLNLDQGKVAQATCPGGSYILQFRHTVQYNELGMNGMQLGNAIKFDARFPLSRIVDAVGHSMSLTINNIPTSRILIDGVPPAITSWLPVINKTYKTGDTIKMEAQVSEKIYITGTPQLEMVVNGQRDTANVITASAPDRLAYGYVVKAGAEGSVMGNAPVPGGAIRDTAGNDLEFIPGPFLYSVYVDGNRPQITAVNTPTLKGKLGDEVPIDVTFNEPIVSTPTALLQATMGGKPVSFTFKTLKDAYTATFVYQVQDGDTDSTGVIVTNVNGITDNAGNALVFTKNDTTRMLIDGIRPVLDSLQLLSGKLTNNPLVSYILHVSELVNSNFMPNFMTTGNIQVSNVQITANGHDLQLDVTTTGDNGSIQLLIDPAQIAIADDFGNTAVQHTLSSEIVRIYITTPVITGIVNPPDGIYRAGDVLMYTIHTSEPPLIKNGVPAMTLYIGQQAVVSAPLSSVNGNTLVFKYTVLDGQEDWDGVFYDYQLQLNNSSITDSAGNIFSTAIPYDPATIPHNTVHAKPAVIDDISTIEPKMVTANDGILIYVRFDRTVKVSQEVTLKVTIGNQTVDAVLNEAINNNPGQAIFQYNTKGGEYDMDGITIDSISLNGGSIKDDFNDAKINFAPKPFTDVQVDAIVPVILSFTRLDPSPTSKDTIRFRAVFNKKMQAVPYYGFLAVKSSTLYTARLIASKMINDSTYDISVRVYGTGTIGLKPFNWQHQDMHGNFVAQDTLVSELYTVDNYPPYVSNLVLPPAHTYKQGDNITIKASISEAVTISNGMPSIDLTLNTGGKVKAYLVKNDSTELTFQYTVKAGELDMDGIRIDSNLQLNGCKMIDAMGNGMYIPMDGVPATTALLVDGVAPHVVSILRASTSPVSKGVVTFMVTLSEANTTITNPANYHLILTGDVQASITNIPAATASFPLTVNVTGGNGTIALSIHNTVTDAAGNTIDLTNAYPNESFVVENIAAKVTGVGVPANGTYKPGDKLTFTVTYNDTVYTKTGDPAPYINVTIGTKVAKAVRTGANGRDQYFEYTVGNNDLDIDGIAVGNAIIGTLLNKMDVPADLTLRNVPLTTGILVDGVAPHIVSIVRASASPVSKGLVTFMVTLSKANTTITNPANYHLILTGDVQASISNIPAATASFPLTVNVTGGNGTIALSIHNTVTDAVGNAIDLANAYPNETFVVENIAAAITGVAVSANGTYKPGDKLTFTVTYNDTVYTKAGDPAPYLNITIGTKMVKALRTGANGRDQYFEYTVGNNDLDIDGIAIGNTIIGTLLNKMGVPADLTLRNVPVTTGILVDGVAPAVIGVSYPPAGRYPLNSALHFGVTFSEPVIFVTTTKPGISFNIAGKPVVANYVSGSGTHTLRFDYIVAAGDEANNITLNNRIQLLAGDSTLTDLVGNASDYTLNAIPANSNVDIDGIAPVVKRITQLSPATTNSSSVQYAIIFSEAVKSFTTANLQISQTGSLTTPMVTLSYPTADSVVVTASNLAGEGTLTVGLKNNATVTDLAGNPLTATPLTAVYTIDNMKPVATLGSSSPARTNKAGLITAVFSEPVVGFNATAIHVQGPGSITGFTGNGTNYGFTLQPQSDGTVTIDVAANGATDAAGNGMTASNKLLITFDLTAPVIAAPGNLSVAERSAAGTVVSTLSATDASQVITGWTITSNADQNANHVPDFAIDASSGVLTVNDPALDYGGVKTVDIQVTTSDGLNTSTAQTITINITDVKSAPADITLNQTGIPENNTANALVGQFSTTDDDLGDTFTYALVSGAGDTDNTAFSISGNTLHVNDVLDYEVKNSYRVRVRTTDSEGLTYEKAFLITVTDVNEAPTLADISGETLCANGDEHTKIVGGVSAGPETAQVITPTITADQTFFSELTAAYNNDGTVTIRYKLTPGASGDAFVTLTIQDNGGTENGGIDKVSKSFVLTVKAAPVLTITATPGAAISIGDIAVLTATGGATYVWADAAGIVSGKNTAALTVRPTTTTTYTLTAHSTEGCVSTATTTITVRDDYKFEATNILTPNGDGINDRWVIKNIDMYPLNNVQIFNRLGKLVYSKTGYNNEWDGTMNGTVLAEDTYYYIVDLGVEGKKNKGFITLLRSNK